MRSPDVDRAIKMMNEFHPEREWTSKQVVFLLDNLSKEIGSEVKERFEKDIEEFKLRCPICNEKNEVCKCTI